MMKLLLAVALVLQGLPAHAVEEGFTTDIRVEQNAYINKGLVVNDNGHTGGLRVESDTNENLLYTDGTNSRVGIGTASPGTLLDVAGTATVDALVVDGAVTQTGAAAFNGGVTLGDAGSDGLTINSSTAVIRSQVNALAISTGTNFDVTAILSFDGANMRLGVGTTSPGTLADIAGTATADSLIVDNGPIRPRIRTKAQLEAIVPAVGDTYSCSDCTLTYSICVATGTAAGQFRVSGASAGCGTNN